MSDLTKRTAATIAVMAFLVGAVLLAALLPSGANKPLLRESRCGFAVTDGRYPDAFGFDPVDCGEHPFVPGPRPRDASDTEWYCDARVTERILDLNTPAPGNDPANC